MAGAQKSYGLYQPVHRESELLTINVKQTDTYSSGIWKQSGKLGLG